MVLDASSKENLSVVMPFSDALEQMRTSANFAIRLTANVILARIKGESPTPPFAERETPAIYVLHLPHLALHRTEQAMEGSSTAVAIDDPARVLSPLDIEIRAVAEIARLPEDNVLYRAVQYFRALETQRTWLAGTKTLDSERLSAFLHKVGLRHSFNKPHISPARHALAYVVAELYDGRYFPSEALPWISKILMHYDPLFILRRPGQRPPWIECMGGIPADRHSSSNLPDRWVEQAKDSLSLLCPRAPDGRIIVAEWTRLRRLDHEWPEEQRMAMVRGVRVHDLWDEPDSIGDHLPFFRVMGIQVADYVRVHAELDHLVVAHDGYDFETPGANWLALNPEVGRAMGWYHIPGEWFRWVDHQGIPVAESIWWSDGFTYGFDEFQHAEVGSGWLVVMTERGFEQVKRQTGFLSRGGVVWRSKGQFGTNGRYHSFGVLES